ncbi:hypothetical protein M0O54_19930 [Acinetobacter lactucae]|uniref:Uncharacterized protein n=1 Tax=Acinetobacter lactucae TaxID=1785128 RepID=A0AB35K3P3_9GAMM|nr:hypothetical protein [Acinetobacter lactucae]MDD9322342.1 hypothetical protein [Acinetobacter lactucae]
MTWCSLGETKQLECDEGVVYVSSPELEEWVLTAYTRYALRLVFFNPGVMPS